MVDINKGKMLAFSGRTCLFGALNQYFYFCTTVCFCFLVFGFFVFLIIGGRGRGVVMCCFCVSVYDIGA